MKTYHWMIMLVLTCLWAQPVSAEEVLRSTTDDQVALEVTVYNNNLGLVKDVRKLTLPKGRGELRFMDVAAQIRPVTVQARSVTDPADFTVLEQNYEYDLMSPEKLLNKYVGKKIKIMDYNRYQDRKEIVDATLLSNNQGQVYQIGEEIYLGHPGIRILPQLPENLIAKPTLTWLYRNTSGRAHNLEVAYLTNNLNWKADYVVSLNKDDTMADVSGWVTIDNKSGATYQQAKLKLVAGEVERVADEIAAGRRMPQAMALLREKAAPSFEEKAFFEYHIYDLQRKTTIKDKQTKQISLLEARGAKISKELLVYGIQSYFARKYRPSNPKQPVSVYVKFTNSKENNLGMPLPKGVMRLYKSDDEGSRQFIGEDRIEHTPKDEEVRLKIGEAFDVVAERWQKDFRQITTRLYESEWEIKLRNHKDEDVRVGIIEPLFGNWEVISKSHSYEKLDASTIKFDVNVPKDGETVVKYRVRVGL